MRSEKSGVWLAAMAAGFVLVSGCAPPNQGGNAGNNKVASIQSPSPSPSPSPVLFAVNGPAFHIGEVGVAYAPVVYSASGGVAPYQWTISAGALPPGLALDAGGTVSGTPTASGTYSFTLGVADSGPDKADIPASITVASALNASLIPGCAKSCNVELGCLNVCGKFATQTGGVGPYKYQVTQGQLPAGTSLSGLSLTGTFSGLSGYLQFTVQVIDSLGATDTVSPTFWMYQHISMAGDNTTCFYIWTDCRLHLKIGGGIPNGRPSIALVGEAPQPGDPAKGGCWNQQSPLPLPNYTMTVSNGYVDVYVPRPSGGYGGVWSLVLTDHTLCAASTNCTSEPSVARIGINCT